MKQNQSIFQNVRLDIVRDAKLLQQIVKQKYNLDIVFYYGFRSIQLQNQLYAKGRTKPGEVVTNARGGYSYHNYGLALDFFILVNGKADWKAIDKFKLVGQEAEKLNFTYGGNFKTIKDYGHVERNYSLTIKMLLAGKRPI